MLYAILSYHAEDVVSGWSGQRHAATMGGLAAVEARLREAGRLGPMARLLPTTAATTLRKGGDPPVVIDGPFAETKEQLLGFYVVECESLDQAIDVARDLARHDTVGAYEIRPIAAFKPGAASGRSSPP